MLQPLKTCATYEDLCAVPELLIAELIDGDLYASSRPPIPYVYTASVLGVRIGTAFDRGSDGLGGWLVLHKPEIHLRDDAIVPDIAREGVSHVWLVNPAIQTLAVLRLESQRWSLIAAHEGGACVRAEPFAALELELARLWVGLADRVARPCLP